LKDDDSKKSFVLYTDFPQATREMTDHAFREVICAACAYTESGEIPELSREARLVFTYLQTTLDRDRAKWEATKARMSAGGRKGAGTRWGGRETEE